MNQVLSLEHQGKNGTGIGLPESFRPQWVFGAAVVPVGESEGPGSDVSSCTPAEDPASKDAADAALIEATARGDRRAFETLYRRYASRLGGYLFKFLRRQDLVEEAFNDVMMVVWRSAERFDGRAKASTWLFGIAHNKALKTLERVRRHRSVDSFEDEATPDLEQMESQDIASNPERQASLGDVGTALETAMGVLSPEQRGVVELTFKEGFSYGEIAEITGVPVNTVKTRMFHARKRLTKALADLDITAGGERS